MNMQRITRAQAPAGGAGTLLLCLVICLFPGGCAVDRGLEDRGVLKRLEKAENAIALKQLTTPYKKSAYYQYQQILKKHPGNEAALLGLSDLVELYLEWALRAMEESRFQQASLWVERAAGVLPEHPNLEPVQRRLAHLREAQRERHPLQAAGLRQRSAQLEAQLHELGAAAHSKKAEVIIQAPNDSDGRWIYQIMNQAGETGRLSATFRFSSEPSVTLIFK